MKTIHFQKFLFELYFLHFSHLDSSDASPQSSFPLHFKFSAIQRPFLQENCPLHVSVKQEKNHLFNLTCCYFNSRALLKESVSTKTNTGQSSTFLPHTLPLHVNRFLWKCDCTTLWSDLPAGLPTFLNKTGYTGRTTSCIICHLAFIVQFLLQYCLCTYYFKMYGEKSDKICLLLW